MIDRENIGVVSEYGYWPRASIPGPVEDYFWNLASRRPEISISQVGKGYHNQGWSYIEVECKAATFAKAEEHLEEMYAWAMCEFQEKK